MTTTIPPCPQCGMLNTYPDGDSFMCADCGHRNAAANCWLGAYFSLS
ncbi:MAG: hypothetical protein NWR39_00525 [Pseudomonadota bacterium]|nr:hypothetical protein [Pseudomonadota bacterium]